MIILRKDENDSIKKEKTSMSFYDKNEMKAFFAAIKGHKLEIPFMLAAYYGFRRSEVLWLRWSAIDFDHKLITVNHKLLVVDKEVILTDDLKTEKRIDFVGGLSYGTCVQLRARPVHAAAARARADSKGAAVLRQYRHVRDGDEPPI